MPASTKRSPSRVAGRSARSVAACRARAMAGRRGRGEAGFTLIEVLATALIVVLIAAGLAVGLIGSTHLSAYQRARAQASALAEQDQERLRGLTAKELMNLNQSRNTTLDGTTYTVLSQAAFLGTGGSTSCNTGGSGAAAYFSATSTVSWRTANAGSASFTAHSLIAPPAGGTLLAAVNDQTGAGLPGVTLSATGPGTDSGITDTHGCIELTGLPTGTYALSFTDPGFVDRNGNATITDSASVTSTGTAFPTHNPQVMGQAASVTASFNAVVGGSTLTGQQADALSWTGQGSAMAMSAPKNVTAGSPQTTFSTTSLFPFAYTSPSISYAGNYQLWSGACQQEQPPTAYNKFTVAPGGAVTGAVQQPALGVFVYYNGVLVPPTSVKLTFSGTTTPTCTDAWYPTIASVPSTQYGVLASPGQPYASGTNGSYTICASYNGVVGYDYNVTNSNMSALNSAPAINLSLTSPIGLC